MEYKLMCPSGCGKVMGESNQPDATGIPYCQSCLETLAKKRAPYAWTVDQIYKRYMELQAIRFRGDQLSPGEEEEMGNLWFEVYRRAPRV